MTGQSDYERLRKQREYQRRYSKMYPDKTSESTKRWCLTHPEKLHEYNVKNNIRQKQQRLAKKLAAGIPPIRIPISVKVKVT